MKQNLLLVSVCAALLQACTPVSTTPEGRPSMPASTASASAQPALSAYYWQLVAASDAAGKPIAALDKGIERPLRLTFVEQNLSISGGCNRQFGGFEHENGLLKVQPLASTLMACEPSLMTLDAEVGRLFKGELRTTFGGDESTPTLQLTTQNGTQLKFQGQPTAETRYGSQGQTRFLEVAAKTVKCSHPLIPDYQCLQVRERRYDAAGLQLPTQDTWHPLYQSIEGYEHQDGVRNVLRVKQYEWKHAPADAPSTVYVLDMVVEQDASAQGH
ncbi:META domain-containing protein [Pseudomonas sp. Os17]|uniref:DUF4377 domain-containing protein n=1 Tax=Pseudomonas protegens TaxID=380021 RepID=A0A2T6GFV3_9PSED|nr:MULTISPECIES: META and DUF4377 domain-containing protein [Pseudomonas]PUA43022.1 DUF4377 domain-containing protein [Pseudomonas protegens]BAQ75004.1 META domain-containing protein [Pseudomonas sp. Os17]